MYRNYQPGIGLNISTLLFCGADSVIWDVPGDGNCVVHAFALALTVKLGIVVKQSDLRLGCIMLCGLVQSGFLVANVEPQSALFSEFLANVGAIGDGSVERALLVRLGTDRAYADNVSMQLLRFVLKASTPGLSLEVGDFFIVKDDEQLLLRTGLFFDKAFFDSKSKHMLSYEQLLELKSNLPDSACRTVLAILDKYQIAHGQVSSHI